MVGILDYCKVASSEQLLENGDDVRYMVNLTAITLLELR